MIAKVLIVDDEELIRWSLSEELQASGYKAIVAPDVRKALSIIQKDPPDVLLTDLRLGDSSGLDILKRVRKEHPEIPVILMTAYADVPSVITALREGAADYIPKPLQLEALKLTLRRVLETADLKSRVSATSRRRRRRFNFDSIVTESSTMKEALATARKIAASQHGTVLLLGESGCGKDLMARAIHFESARSMSPFIEVSCTAIPDHLLESELFGYEKGAFTGAMQRKKGLFELASGGTVFLNEIGHMPLALQAKLLRVLEDSTFMRVGGQEDITIDARIIAATNEDMERAVSEGRFRADLYYRINVLSIKLLPLRERPEDIPKLVEKLLARLCLKLGRPVPRISDETMKSFLEYAWPGNVRELRNALERILILGDEDLRPILHAGQPPDEKGTERDKPLALPETGLRLEDVEKELVRQALDRTRGNQQKAAQLLGIGRDALRRRIEKFGLKDPPPRT